MRRVLILLVALVQHPFCDFLKFPDRNSQSDCDTVKVVLSVCYVYSKLLDFYLIIMLIMLAYFYCAAYIRMKVNESSTICDRRSIVTVCSERYGWWVKALYVLSAPCRPKCERLVLTKGQPPTSPHLTLRVPPPPDRLLETIYG